MVLDELMVHFSTSVRKQDLPVAKAAARRRALFGQISNLRQLEAMTSLYLKGLPLKLFKFDAGRIQGVDEVGISAFYQHFFDPRAFVTVTVGAEELPGSEVIH